MSILFPEIFMSEEKLNRHYTQLCTHMAVSAFTGMFAGVWRIFDTVVYVIIFYMAQFLL